MTNDSHRPLTTDQLPAMRNRRVAVRAIVAKENKLLCARLKINQGIEPDSGRDFWCTPGGGADIGEPLAVALERELVEETGVKPIVGSLLYVQQFQHNDWEHLEFFFHVTNYEDYEQIQLESTSHGAIEIAEIDFIDPSSSKILPTFLTRTNVAADIAAGVTQFYNNFSD